MEEKIKNIISEYLGCIIEDDNELLYDYGFDSLKAIGIIVEVEENFNIIIPNELLAIENWDSLSKIKKLVFELVNA